MVDIAVEYANNALASGIVVSISFVICEQAIIEK